MAVLGFSALAVDASSRLPDRHPSIKRCIENPTKFQGRMIWIQHSPVIESTREWFDIERPEFGRVRVVSPYSPPVGHYVMVQGVYLGGRQVRGFRYDLNPRYGLQRTGVYLVSIAALIGIAWALRRRFVWRDGAVHPRT